MILTERLNMSYDLRVELAQNDALHANDGETFRFRDVDEWIRYFKLTRSVGALFTYISCLIVRRDDWMRQPALDQFMGSAYIHVAKILAMLQVEGSLVYVRTPCVINRMCNDSFLASAGSCGRCLIDLNLLRIADHFFKNRHEVNEAIKRTVRQETFGWKRLLWTRRLSYHLDRGSPSVQLLEEGYRENFSDQFDYWPKILAWRLAPSWLLDLMYRLKQVTKTAAAPEENIRTFVNQLARYKLANTGENTQAEVPIAS